MGEERFRGHFAAKIDSQGRLKIPTAYKTVFEKQYGPELYVTSLNGDFITVYPMAIWERVESKLSEVSDGVKDKFVHLTGFWGQQLSMDKQGRIQIHPRLRSKAGLEGEVAVIGQFDRLTIWDLKTLEQRIESNPFTAEDRQELAKLGV
jgi:MraZ protein